MPTPRVKRPSPSSTADVAAACATIAGCVRTVGQVTAVVTGRSHTCATAPIIDHTNGDCPWALFHGWKWSLIQRLSKPARSASRACSRSWSGAYSSQERK